MKVKFWPVASSIPVEVCKHRYGAEMTFSQMTDTVVLSSVYAAELYGFKNNLRLGVNISPFDGVNDDVKITEETGLLRHDIYLMTDYWKNPVTDAIEVIPDYYATAWTAAGVAVFANAVLGAAKATRTPNHGKELYDISDGAYGYDHTSETYGASNASEFFQLADYLNTWFKNTINREASAAGYRNGQTGCNTLAIKKYLGIRNSSRYDPPAEANTYYGNGLGHPDSNMQGDLIRDLTDSYYNSSRSYDYWYSDPTTKKPIFIAWITDQIQKTIINHGWLRDFCHWHNLRDSNTLPDFDTLLQAVRSGAGSNFIHTCGSGEAIEYMYLREIIKRVIAKEKDGSVYLVVDVVDKFKSTETRGIENDLNLNCINIPISVKVDLTNTCLDGKTVKSNQGKIRSLGNDVYIVEIPFSHQDGFSNVILSEGADGIHTETIPTSTFSINGSILTVMTNIPTKAVLYSVATGGNEYDSMPEDRNNVFSTQHGFDIEAGKDYRVGIISEFLQSDLITIS